MNQYTKHGSGSAQLGPASGFAFVRGRLLAPEGDGGAAGGSSGGEGSTTTTPTTTPSQGASTTQGDSGTAPGGGSEKLLPQSQVNTLVANARREGREQALRESQQVTQQQAKKPDPGPKSDADRLAALEAELADTKARSAFDKHAARLGVSDELAEDLFALSKAQRPENVGEWLASKVERFGLKPAPATPAQGASATTAAATSAASNTAPSESAKPPVAAPSAPSKVDPLTGAGLVDIWNLSDAQLMQLGPAGLRAEFEKILAVARQQQGAPARPKLPGR